MLAQQAFSTAGGHAVNEDAFRVQLHPADPDCWLGVLADGQGGRAGGGRAAMLACATAIRIATQSALGSVTNACGWNYLLQAADQAVTNDPEAGCTTLVGFSLRRGRAVGAANGDSALLLVNEFEATVLTAHQRKQPPVGSGAAQFTEFSAPLGTSWRVAAVTDGVWKYVGWDRLIDAVRTLPPEAVIEHLQALARLPGSGTFVDDFTVLLLWPVA